MQDKPPKNNFWMRSTELSPYLDLAERRQIWTEHTRVIDIYPGYWTVDIYDEVPEGTTIRVGRKVLKLAKNMALYIPPYALVEWNFPIGKGAWRTYCTEWPPEKFFPQDVAVFFWDPKRPIRDYDDLAAVMRDASSGMSSLTMPEFDPSVERIKYFMQKHFREDLQMEEVYRDLRIPASTANFWMHKATGVSPIYYRNKLRIFEALFLIATGTKAIDACYKVGFNDYSRFYRQFYASLGVSPSEFSAENIIKRAA